MSKYKPSVNFHEKEMSLLEAKLYLCGLKFYIVNADLNEEENIQYQKLLNLEKNRNELARKRVGINTRKEPTKRDYLINLLERKIDATKMLEKMEYCKKHGHKEKKGSEYTPPSIDKKIVYVHCKTCGTVYEKKQSPQKDKGLAEKTYNPFRG